MTDPGTPRQDEANEQARAVATYLWGEYQYRHDLVWQLVFRVTAVATLLLIAPLLANDTVRCAVRPWLVALPVIAILVILVACFVLRSELQLLRKIRNAYREVQNQALHHLECWVPHELCSASATPKKWGLIPSRGFKHFEQRVVLFLLLILAAALFFLILFLAFWQDELYKQCPVGNLVIALSFALP